MHCLKSEERKGVSLGEYALFFKKEVNGWLKPYIKADQMVKELLLFVWQGIFIDCEI